VLNAGFCALIDEHVRATGVDPKIPPIDLLATDFKERVQEHKSDRAKASEIEHAIKHHINVKLDEDPEYYKSLSEKLNGIIEKHKEHWDELVQMLMDFRDDIETKPKPMPPGIGPAEGPFYNILMAEIARARDDEAIDQSTHDEVIEITKKLVGMLDEATAIVDFFNKPDEVSEITKQIKRTLVGSSFDAPELRNVVMDRFLELAKVRFRE
jgi:type I restriction enzyme R subunit